MFLPELLIDTHTLFWYLCEPSLLSEVAVSAMRKIINQGLPLSVASISLVEIYYLLEKNRLPEEFLIRIDVAKNEGFIQIVSLDDRVAKSVCLIERKTVPDMPDRIIAATALCFNIPLVTKDQRILKTKVKTIW